MPTTLRLVKHVRIRGRLRCVTGLRIGGSKDDVEVGGSDNPIIRHPLTKLPYIPGSSIKGKLRSTLEYKFCNVQSGEPCGCAREDCLVCTVFGPHKRAMHALGPSRILVRDASLTPESEERLYQLQESDGLLFAESKTENMIDRRTGVAMHPRTQERVPAETVFALNISLRIFASDDEEKLVAFVKGGLEMLEDEYLGGSGSRGYGQVKLEDLEIT